MSTPATTSQTVGPYYRIGLAHRFGVGLCADHAPGEHITLTGVLYDGNCVPVPDAQLELWQADHQGHFAGLESGTEATAPGFKGFARIPFDDEGHYRFHTIKPGAVTAQDGTRQAPHIVVMVFMRGILKHLCTRIYFPDEPLNATDTALTAVPADRRATLIARQSVDTPGEFIWNIHLQGDEETAFFAY